MRYGQNVIVIRRDHPLFDCKGFVYRVSGDVVTVLFDKEIFLDFPAGELTVSDQQTPTAVVSIIEYLG